MGKGTNRAAFFRGEVDKYSWVDIGSSFLPSELIAAFLFAQLENIDDIQNKRKQIWNYYFDNLKDLETKGYLKLQKFTPGGTNNAHLFYLLTNEHSQQLALLEWLNKNGIQAVFHYLPLHSSPYFTSKHDERELNRADYFSENIIRLPFFYDLKTTDQDVVINKIKEFFTS